MKDKENKTKQHFNYQLFYRRTALIIYDILSVTASSFLAILLRYDMHLDEIPDQFLMPIRNFLPLNILLTMGIFYLFRLYHSLWAFAGENEMQSLVMACFLSAVVSGVGLNLFKVSGKPVPDSYYFMYLFMLISFTFVSRFSYRFLRSHKHRLQNKKNNISVMIIGAGEAGNALIKEIVTSNYSTMVIRCIIDDDKQKMGQFIQGIKVVGGRDKIIESADLYDIDEIFIAMPSAPRTEIRDILDICKETSCKLRSLPGMYQLVNGEVSVSKLRDVEVEDLLGREPIRVDLDSILSYVQNKVVMVTGGGGSIGSELCRQVASHKPAHLVIVDIYENNAYDIQQELIIKYPELKLTVLIASVRNTKRINHIFETYKPDIVLYDVLGDVVCGGFSMPMRKGYADKVLIITSGENMAIHAGANIAMAVQNFRNRGYAALGGIILNRRNVKREEEKVQELAEDFETKVIGKLTHSDLVTDAEEQGKTLMECYPESEMATEYRILAEQILNLCREDGLC